jgi:hypothetical protein
MSGKWLRTPDMRDAPRGGVLSRANMTSILTLPASFPRGTSRVSSIVTTFRTGP